MALRDEPLLTEIYTDASSFLPAADSLYIFGTSPEERSTHLDQWRPNSGTVSFARITRQDPTEIDVQTNKEIKTLPLRSQTRLRSVWSDAAGDVLYLDITGLQHHVWAPLVRSALTTGKRLQVIYVEPGDYTYSATPTEGEIFDLSERISGIAPLPGFAVLANHQDANVCFVPLLGFEGTRLAYLIEQVEPPGSQIVPVIGVPGFRAEYPFHTYIGNRFPLLESRAWKNARYATANCPFSLYYALDDIAGRFPGHMLKIAPIGTKPHALGAVLYALTSVNRVELIYDHPIRKPTRTTGISRLLVYDVAALGLNRAAS